MFFPRQIITIILVLCLYQNTLALSVAVGREQRIRMGSRKHPWHWEAQCLSTEAPTASLLPETDLHWPQALCVLINLGLFQSPITQHGTGTLHPAPHWSACSGPPLSSGCEIHLGLGRVPKISAAAAMETRTRSTLLGEWKQ